MYFLVVLLSPCIGITIVEKKKNKEKEKIHLTLGKKKKQTIAQERAWVRG